MNLSHCYLQGKVQTPKLGIGSLCHPLQFSLLLLLSPAPPANTPNPMAPRETHAAFPHPMSFSQLTPYLNPPALGCCLKSNFFLEGFGSFHQLEATSNPHSSLYLHHLTAFIPLPVCAHEDMCVYIHYTDKHVCIFPRWHVSQGSGSCVHGSHIIFPQPMLNWDEPLASL